MKLDPNLEQFATPRQWQLLEAWEEHGSGRKAAASLGVNKSLVDRAKSAVLKKAALRGYSPDYAQFNVPGVPPGFVLRGQSVLVNADGSLRERWDKTTREGRDPDEAVVLPDPKKLVGVSTMADAEGRVIVQWTKERPEDVAREAAWRQFADELKAEIPRVRPLKMPTGTWENKLAGYPVGDHHLGMLAWWHETGESWDMKIAEKMIERALSYLMNAVGPADRALLAFLGDFLHYDNFETVTPTSRNILDSDSRFPKMIRVAIRIMRGAIDMALQQHREVHVKALPGNHDLATMVILAELLAVAYENEPRVTVDTTPRHFQYYRYGQNLIGVHHGHGTKMQNLPLIMAADMPDEWGGTRHRTWWTGHIHKSVTQAATSAHDYSGVSVESFRVLPPPDAWAAQKGYRPIRDMKGILFDEEHGEVARHTVSPQMLGMEGL